MIFALFDVFGNGRPDFDTVYSRCVVCGLVGTCKSADYPLTDVGEYDPGREIRLTCSVGGHRYTITGEAVLQRDAVRLCGRDGCDTVIACPATADEVVCPVCRLHQDGPFLDLDSDRRGYIVRVRSAFAAEAHARWRHKRER